MNRFMQYLIIIVWSGTCACPVAGQDDTRVFKPMARDEGMSYTSVYSILKDRRGLMWFASDNGLVQFDGYQVIYYEHEPSDTFSLADNTLSYVAEDTSGGIWIATWGSGLDFFDPRSGRFFHHKSQAGNPDALGDNRIHVVFVDSRGGVWIGGYSGGLQKFDPVTNTFKHYLPDSKKQGTISSARIWSICETGPGILWLGTDNGLNRFDMEKEQFRVYQYSRKNKSSISHNRVRCVRPGLGGKLWVGTQDGLNWFDTKTGNSVRYFKTRKGNSLNHDVINSVYQDSSGRVWIGMDGGGLDLLEMIPGKGKKAATERFTHHTHNPKDLSSLSDNNVRFLYADPAGILWIATRGGGVNLLDLKPKKFAHFVNDPGNKNSLNYNRIFALFEDDDESLWIGTDGGGLNRYMHDDKKFIHYVNNPKDKKSLHDNRIRAIEKDPDGYLWLGTYNGGLSRFSRKKKTFTPFKHNPDNPNSLSHNTVLSLLCDRRGLLWIGTDFGLNVFNPKTEKFSLLKSDPSKPEGLPDNRILALFEDKQGSIWAGTENGGVCRIEMKDGRFDPGALIYTTYRHEMENANSLSHNRVFCVFEDHSGYYWIGTTGGLNRLDVKNSSIVRYTEYDGLPSNVIRGILEDNARNLWISSNRGLSRYFPASGKFRNYDVYDGLQSNEFNEGAYFRGKAGIMFFGGIHGFNRFDPSDIHDNTVIPSIVITGFRKFGKPVKLNPDISFAEEIVLAYSENVFSFEFSALEFSNPQKNQYAYQLEGFDKDWVFSGNQRMANYTNLDPGRYVFRVKGSNHDNIWNETGVSVRLVITPPFWERWWFRSLVVLAVAGVIIGLIRWRISAVQSRNVELESLVEKRTAELKHKNAEVVATLESLKQTRDQLIQAEKMSSLGQMVAGIAHEVNTPRATVDHYVFVMNRKIAEVLQRNDPDQIRQLFKNQVEEILPSIKLANDRIGEIVEGLLNFTRMDLSEFRQADIHQMINSVLIILKNLYKGRIEIIREFAQIPQIDCYPGQLSQLFMNIILNSIEAIPAGGYIRLTTEMADNDTSVLIRIKDTGTGMPEEVKLKIFDPFFTTKELGKGKGLGLSVAYSIVGNHHGRIEFESALGEGTEFMIALPVTHK